MRWIVALLIVPVLAGCASAPEVPADAVLVASADLPGIELAAWTEERDGFTYLRAVATNDGEPLATKEDCGYLWQSELRRGNESLVYQQPLEQSCDWWHHTMATGDFREFLHSWDGRTWNNGTGEEAPAGDYVWIVRFLARDGSDHETQTPVEGRFLEAVVSFTR